MAKVKIYTTIYCPFCIRAKMLLDSKGIRYEEVAVDDAPELREEMRTLSGRHTVPQIFIDNTPIGGCDELYQLESQGKLEHLL